jgi:hypothetical protein
MRFFIRPAPCRVIDGQELADRAAHVDEAEPTHLFALALG